MRATQQTAVVTFKATGYTSVTCLIDQPGVIPTSDGYAGWDVVPRPKNTPLLSWTGYGAFSIPVPIIFDNADSMVSVEPGILALEKMAGRGPGVGGQLQPPDITVSTAPGFEALIPHNPPPVPWVITALEWDTDPDTGFMRIQGLGGQRVRQRGLVTLSHHTAADKLVQLSAAKRASSSKTPRHTRHTVKKGETLQGIANREYGSSNLWRAIANANGITDPRHLRVGKVLKLPKLK